MISVVGDLLFFVALAVCVVTRVSGIKNREEMFEDDGRVAGKYGNIAFLAILMLSIVCISYKVGEIPRGFHVDEAGAFYDAVCLSEYGVDRYLYKLPVYLINFGGGQNALYTYLAAILFKIFGVSKVVFRLPAIILSCLSMICLYKMIKENNSGKEALFSTFVLAICPWYIMKSRWGLESYLMCSLMTISSCIFLKAINTAKRGMYFFAGILWGLTLYTYAISYMVVPAVIGIIVIYMLIIRKIDIKNIILMAIPLGILAIPLILMLAKNSGIIENVQIPLFSIPELWFYRGGEISLKNIPQNIMNIFDILFIKDFLNYNAISEFGTLYRLSISLVIFGLIEVTRNVIRNIKQKEFSLDFLMLITFIVIFFTGLCLTELNINKINAIYIPMIYFIGRFMMYISKNIKYGAIAIIVFYCLNGVMFLNHYFTEFANIDLMYFEEDIIEASKKAETLQKDNIYVENRLNQTYIYTLVATPISPYELNKDLQIDNGVVVAYGKYKFEIPEKIEENAVYVIKENQDKINELIENGFSIEKCGEFSILWSE